jgi:hypothetical protein
LVDATRRGERLVLLLAPIVLLLSATDVHGQAIRNAVIRGLEVEELQAGWLLKVSFNFPVRYRGHSPQGSGALLQVDFAPIAVPEGGALLLLERESLRPPDVRGLGLLEVNYEGDGAAPVLIMRFAEEVALDVAQGADFRSLEVRVTPLSVAPVRSSVRVGTPGEELLSVGRRAMTAGDLERAVAIFEILLSEERGESETVRRDALELLGLARERNGQLAHAQAEYEAYLARYPEGEGADRVRQRLSVLLTLQEQPRPDLRPIVPRGRDDSSFELYGSVAASYLRSQELVGEREDRVYDSVMIADLDVSASYEGERFEFLGIAAGSYRYDFESRSTARDARVGTLLLDVRDREGYSATLGRQARSNGGVLGRFDGLSLTLPVAADVEVSALAGFPLRSTASPRVSTGRQIFGAAVDFRQIIDGLDAQLFTVAQRVGGLTDRVGVGAELRYSTGRIFGLAFVDYDAYLNSLNTLLLTGSLRLDSGGDIHAQVETRNSPILTLESALQGQVADDLDELSEEYSVSEMRELAKDRTARSYRGSIGASIPIAETLRLGGDLGLGARTGTSSSGGVPGTRGSGLEVAASLLLTKSDLLMRGGVGSAQLRTFIGDVFDTYSVRVTTRFPIRNFMRVEPRLLATYRKHNEGGDDSLILRPALRMGLRRWRLHIDAEVGLEWASFFGARARDDELAILTEIVLRYDF